MTLMKPDLDRFVGIMDEWAKVAAELQGEDLKQKIYDNTLLDLCGDLKDKKVLDYGAGPGVIAKRIARVGARVHAYDVSPDMLRIAAQNLGSEKVHTNVSEVTNGSFDIVFCNLVVCIVPEEEVVRIARNIRAALTEKGKAYVGFCNPKLYNVPESLIDFRHSTGDDYEQNHKYRKTKKEGNYDIDELHRPIGWYQGIWNSIGLKCTKVAFTPEYATRDGKRISDFIIFELVRGESP
ncbi:class I SAM-dependent methyltransferase [Candidatus Micrarchaeota archaeon]|nr:class I SAM-dependent methyltransferase [Candidatus Micrarchaeota archaeon]